MPIFETVAKGDSNPGSLDCESGIVPLSYRAPNWCSLITCNWYVIMLDIAYILAARRAASGPLV